MLLLEEKLGGWFFSSWSPGGLSCVHKTVVSQVVCALNGMRQTALITACCEDEGDFVTQWHGPYCLGVVCCTDICHLWILSALVQILPACPVLANCR
jgi:hypothetical protein